ncbi:MAG: IPT/TIG domain-containing protein [Gammaproteobacteria bacterium]|nr:IPT/TIG domain-containing protein [Gammaproteobacteria bacterium]
MKRILWLLSFIALFIPIALVAQIYSLDSTESYPKPALPNENQALSFSASNFGFTGPFTLGGQYSKLYGYTIKGQWTQGLGASNAFSLALEWGDSQHRYSATYGIALSESQRLKATIERLEQNMSFDFDSGTVKNWVGQNAFGATYAYLVAKGIFHDVNLNVFSSKAESKNFDSKFFIGSDRDTYENFRHITGGENRGVSLGVNIQPHWSNLLGLAVNYEELIYKPLYDKSIKSSYGFGAAVNFEQLISDHFKFKLGASKHAPYYDYSTELDWLLYSMPNSKVELALVGELINGEDGLPNDSRIGLNVNYALSGSYSKPANYSLGLNSGSDSLVNWVATPAVYMQQVLAVKDQMTIRVLNPTIDFGGQEFLMTVGQYYNLPITQYIVFGCSHLQSVTSNILANFGLAFNLINNGTQVYLVGTPVLPPSMANTDAPEVKTPIDITVTNAGGKVSTGSFILDIITNPKALSIRPTTGLVETENPVEIFGANFSLSGNTTVKFNTLSAGNVRVIDQGHINATTPKVSESGAVNVTIINPDGGQNTLTSGFTFTPGITSVTPAKGPKGGGTFVTIVGAGFKTGAKVYFDSALSPSVTFISSTTLKVELPAHVIGDAVVKVLNPNNTSAIWEQKFTFLDPTGSIIPHSAAETGNVSFTISGYGFMQNASVSFGNTSATPLTHKDDGTEITGTVPPHAPGTPNVTVTNPDSSNVTISFTYHSNIHLTSITPDQASKGGNTNLVIIGTGLYEAVNGKPIVIFGSESCNATANSVSGGTTLNVTVPACNPGVGDQNVNVTVKIMYDPPQYSDNSLNFIYLQNPKVLSVSPNQARFNNATPITLTGYGFLNQSGALPTVQFGSAGAYPIVNATAVSADGTNITFSTPVLNHTGVVNQITVINPGSYGNGTLNANFTFYSGPNITSITPSFGPGRVATPVTINGTDFVHNATVHFGNVTITNGTVSADGKTINLFTPATQTGVVGVFVENPPLSEVSNTVNFTYNTPVISNVTPSRAVGSGWPQVQITGAYLMQEGATLPTVHFGASCNATASWVSAANDTLNVTVPVCSGHNGDVVLYVTNPDGGISNDLTFTLLANPEIVNISPASLPDSPLPQNVTINGYGFTKNGAELPSIIFGHHGNESVQDVSANGTSITVSVTNYTYPPGATNVTVINPAGYGNNTSVNGFTFISHPIITSLSPNYGYNGTNLTINGNDFYGPVTVQFGSLTPVSANVSGDGKTVATVVSGLTDGATYAVKVINNDTTTSNTQNFYYSEKLSIQCPAPNDIFNRDSPWYYFIFGSVIRDQAGNTYNLHASDNATECPFGGSGHFVSASYNNDTKSFSCVYDFSTNGSFPMCSPRYITVYTPASSTPADNATVIGFIDPPPVPPAYTCSAFDSPGSCVFRYYTPVRLFVKQFLQKHPGLSALIFFKH